MYYGSTILPYLRIYHESTYIRIKTKSQCSRLNLLFSRFQFIENNEILIFRYHRKKALIPLSFFKTITIFTVYKKIFHVLHDRIRCRVICISRRISLTTTTTNVGCGSVMTTPVLN